MASAEDIYGTPWKEREYLITLHAYFNHKAEPQHSETPFVLELSKILGRTSHSILYRLQNYASVDPEELDPRRKGKSHVSDLVRRLFALWSSKRDSLRDTAEAFLRDERVALRPDLFNVNPARLPTTFRQYEILDEIGKGRFGVVFSCLNTETGEPCAMKVINGIGLHDAECLRRLRREILALRTVRRTSVIRIYDDNLEHESNYPAYVMELAEYDLPTYVSVMRSASLDRGRRPILTTEESARILASMLDAAEALHKADSQIIHRDINPNNILRMFDGRWVLADFSVAKFLPPAPVSTSFVTETRVGMGTAHYASPEQYEDFRQADSRSDVHALGWLVRDLYSTELYPQRQPSGLPRELEKVFLKATAYRREDRYQTVGEMRRELGTVLGIDG